VGEHSFARDFAGFVARRQALGAAYGGRDVIDRACVAGHAKHPLCPARRRPHHGIMDQNPYAAPTVDPRPSPTFTASGPRDWTVGQAIGVGWETTKANFLPLVGGFTLVLIVNQVIQTVLQRAFGLGTTSTDPMAALTGMAAFLPVAIFLSIYFTIGQFRVALAAARGEEFQFARFFTGYDRLLPGLLVTIVVYLGVVVGTLFLIIPGIIIGLGWSMVLPLVADSTSGPGEMLSESWNATKGQRGQIFLFYLACCGVAILGLLALGVGILVAFPVIMIAMAEVYMCVTGRRAAEG
jgi:hypothetical protein